MKRARGRRDNQHEAVRREGTGCLGELARWCLARMEGLIFLGMEGGTEWEEMRLGVWAECLWPLGSCHSHGWESEQCTAKAHPFLPWLRSASSSSGCTCQRRNCLTFVLQRKEAGVSQEHLPSVAWGCQAQPEMMSGLVHWRPEASLHDGYHHTSSVPHTDLSTICASQDVGPGHAEISPPPLPRRSHSPAN